MQNNNQNAWFELICNIINVIMMSDWSVSAIFFSSLSLQLYLAYSLFHLFILFSVVLTYFVLYNNSVSFFDEADHRYQYIVIYLFFFCFSYILHISLDQFIKRQPSPNKRHWHHIYPSCRRPHCTPQTVAQLGWTTFVVELFSYNLA